MKYKVVNQEVLYTVENITTINRDDIDKLKELAKTNPRKRIRLCTHHDIQDDIHEMIIVHSYGTYVPPHKHVGKSESFHVIEGLLNIVLFDEIGNVERHVYMGDKESGKHFYYRIPDDCFHTVIPITEVVVFHEVTKGPFLPEKTIFASWAPNAKDDIKLQQAFQNSIV